MFCNENFLTQHVCSPTRIVSSAILDLVFSTQGTVVSNLSVNEQFGSSDHSIIQFSINIRSHFSSKKVLMRNLNSADWNRFNDILCPSLIGMKLSPLKILIEEEGEEEENVYFSNIGNHRYNCAKGRRYRSEVTNVFM